ncbi:hypothetical protein H1164_14880 [Thermoactinomyces daqus]|uniref:Acetyltransferase n=1 Tax=Thermoactinomyces daqus TaxID=1329516 RepID=A0A7W2AJU1_9BACL|nr:MULTISPECIES: hypothetical protein [Thermoactinomyces]MBA4544154.1 hypothetical protein [Thermoactinomyces daqus]MBH8602628.1 hypothetical protein [Thermoactinomyces sp. CICC 10522]
MNIRPAMIADAQEIAKVHVKSWQTTYRGIVSEDYLTSLNPEESAARWEKHLRSDSVTYVAETPEKKSPDSSAAAKSEANSRCKPERFMRFTFCKKYRDNNSEPG